MSLIMGEKYVLDNYENYLYKLSKKVIKRVV